MRWLAAAAIVLTLAGFFAAPVVFARIVFCGAVAFGRTLRNCNGDIQQWRAHAVVLDKERFEEGQATVVAMARTSDDGEITDTHQWLVNVTLIDRR